MSPTVPIISVDTLRTWQHEDKALTLVDTLPEKHFAAGHLPGAINIVSDDIVAQAPSRLPDRDARIVVYCASVTCRRAGLAAERLQKLGYTHVSHLASGKRGWLAAGETLMAEKIA